MTTQLKIQGMSCGHCVAAVKGALEGVAGVHQAEVTLEPGRAVVDHESDTSADALVAAVVDEGYGATRE
ncbi:MAG: cation transporter [Fimbriimonadaceae bacterium]|nr:cation transporter [Chthonomonadaceae bacterium]MCO5297841.1 cation transporter [Fimbriimonadaceae bacterium]